MLERLGGASLPISIVSREDIFIVTCGVDISQFHIH